MTRINSRPDRTPLAAVVCLVVLAAALALNSGCGSDGDTGPNAGTVVITVAPSGFDGPWLLSHDGVNNPIARGRGNAVIEVAGGTNLTMVWGDSIGWLKPDPSREDATLAAGRMVNFRGTFQPWDLGTFVRFEADTFRMGGLDHQGWLIDPDEKPEHEVIISRDFLLGATEVSQAQYGAVTGSIPSVNLECRNCPAALLNWYDAVRFCNAASLLAGYDPAYTIGPEAIDPLVTWDRDANGYRLPTEAEWEFAARRETTYRFCTGSTLASVAWYDDTSGNVAHPVGELDDCGGLYDIHGNISEFCWDWYGAYPAGPVTDPLGPATGSTKVSRGGAFDQTANNCRNTVRGISEPNWRDRRLGIRLARNAD